MMIFIPYVPAYVRHVCMCNGETAPGLRQFAHDSGTFLFCLFGTASLSFLFLKVSKHLLFLQKGCAPT